MENQPKPPVVPDEEFIVPNSFIEKDIKVEESKENKENLKHILARGERKIGKDIEGGEEDELSL
jgi:hypothetical protein